VLAFVRAWANRADGVSGSGRRVDAVVWAYGVGTVAHPALLSEADPAKGSVRPALELLDPQEEERARFLFFTAFLPQILHAVQTSAIKSLRIVALVDPIYPAGFKTSPLLVPADPPVTPETSATSPSSAADTPAAAASRPSKAPKPLSAAVTRAHQALRTIVFVSHFQRILDALARENEALSTIPLPSAESAQPAAAASTTHVEAQGETLEPAPATQVKEERRSAVLVTAVSPGWHFSSILWPFLARQSPGSLLVPTLCVVPPRPVSRPRLHPADPTDPTQVDRNAPITSAGRSFCQTERPERPLCPLGAARGRRLGERHQGLPAGVVRDLPYDPTRPAKANVLSYPGCRVPPALLKDEKLGRQVWEEMEASLLDAPEANAPAQAPDESKKGR